MTNEIFLQLLSDIAVIKPERLQYYESLFAQILEGRDAEYTFVFDDKTSTYELTYSERGIVVGGMKENSAEDFRISFLQHEFFPIRYKTAQTDIELLVSRVYPLFEDKTAIRKRIEAYIDQYRLCEFDYANMRFMNT